MNPPTPEPAPRLPPFLRRVRSPPRRPPRPLRPRARRRGAGRRDHQRRARRAVSQPHRALRGWADAARGLRAPARRARPAGGGGGRPSACANAGHGDAAALSRRAHRRQRPSHALRRAGAHGLTGISPPLRPVRRPHGAGVATRRVRHPRQNVDLGARAAARRRDGHPPADAQSVGARTHLRGLERGRGGGGGRGASARFAGQRRRRVDSHPRVDVRPRRFQTGAGGPCPTRTPDRIPAA
jgi:hypothetical protein